MRDDAVPEGHLDNSETEPENISVGPETEYMRRLRRLGSDDNVMAPAVRISNITEVGLKSRLLGKINITNQVVHEVERAAKHLIFTDDYELYANQPALWRQAVIANRTGDAHDGESVEHDQPVVWTENARRLPQLVALIDAYIDPKNVRSVRIFEVKTGGFILVHVDYIEFEDGFSRVHLPIVTANGAVTVEGNVAFRMRAGEFWFLESRVPHTAGNFAPSARYHVAIDCDPRVPLEELLIGPVAAAEEIALVVREPLSIGRDQLVNGLAPMLTPISIRSALNWATEHLFQYEIGAGEVHQLMTAAAAVNGDPRVIAKVATLRELLIGTDAS